MDIIESNHLIDVFMESPGEYVSHNGMYEGRVLSTYQPHLYHLDWNLLMDVVDKIESLEYKVIISNNNVVIVGDMVKKEFKHITSVSENTKREAVYNAVVSFIEWFNNK